MIWILWTGFTIVTYVAVVIYIVVIVKHLAISIILLGTCIVGAVLGILFILVVYSYFQELRDGSNLPTTGPMTVTAQGFGAEMTSNWPPQQPLTGQQYNQVSQQGQLFQYGAPPSQNLNQPL